MQTLDKQIIELYRGNEFEISYIPNTNTVLTSNGYEVLSFPAEYYPGDVLALPELGIATYNQLNVLGIFTNTLEKTIPTITLAEAISNVQNSQIACDACRGNKEVEYSFEYAFKEFIHKATCPVCKGLGYQDTFPWKQARIGNNNFYLLRLQKLLTVIQALNEPNIMIIYEGNAGTNFKIGFLTITIIRTIIDENRPPIFEL